MKGFLRSLDEPVYYVKFKYIVLWAVMLIAFFTVLQVAGAIAVNYIDMKYPGTLYSASAGGMRTNIGTASHGTAPEEEG